MDDESKTYYCEKCKKVLRANQFYTSNNLEKYPNDGKLRQCRQCITMHVDNWNPETYTWILQEVDVPYVPEEWFKLLSKYAKDRSKVTGSTILGRYLASMKLKQFKDYRWKDSEFIQQLNEEKLRATMKMQGYDIQQIEQAVVDMQTGITAPPKPPDIEPPQDTSFSPIGFEDEDYFESQVGAATNPDLDLTPEDIIMLRLKWGKTYKPEEWVRLEQLYNEMMESYDIQQAGHIDTLKLICKTSLKANQLLDIGDVDGAQKMIKMYDGLMKSGHFTANQNKTESGDFVDSISELVALCEKDGFIPRYYTEGPQDKIDRVIQDMQEYTHTLVTEEMHLGSLIERAVKQIESDREKDNVDDIDDDNEEEALEKELFDTEEEELSDDDFEDFEEFKEEQKKETAAAVNEAENNPVDDFFSSLLDEFDEEDGGSSWL